MTTRLPLSLQKPTQPRDESGQFVSGFKLKRNAVARDLRRSLGLAPHPALGGGV